MLMAMTDSLTHGSHGQRSLIVLGKPAEVPGLGLFRRLASARTTLTPAVNTTTFHLQTINSRSVKRLQRYLTARFAATALHDREARIAAISDGYRLPTKIVACLLAVPQADHSSQRLRRTGQAFDLFLLPDTGPGRCISLLLEETCSNLMLWSTERALYVECASPDARIEEEQPPLLQDIIRQVSYTSAAIVRPHQHI